VMVTRSTKPSLSVSCGGWSFTRVMIIVIIITIAIITVIVVVLIIIITTSSSSCEIYRLKVVVIETRYNILHYLI